MPRSTRSPLRVPCGAASCREGLAWLRGRPDLEVLDLRPRYLPPVGRHLLRVPGLREIVTWNLWMVLRKRP